MINVWIDEMTPCLKDNLTGELISTEVLRVRRKSFLQKFNKKNGWYVNWAELLEHYCKTFNADFLGMLHPYQMMIDEENAAKIMEVYDYEWTDDEL